MSDRSLIADARAAARRTSGQPEPGLRERVTAAILAEWSQLPDHRTPAERFADAALDVIRPELDKADRLLDAKQAEADRLRALIERGFDTHMQFGVTEPDGTTTMLPCADWCYACKLEKAEAERDSFRAQLAAAGLVPVDQPPGAVVLECSRALLRTHDGASWAHHSHVWETQPGAPPVWCPGVPAPKDQP